ncbi:MAG TPA: sigma-54 dependent transcriptional regulator [Gemmatimonadaceae bacterium]
MPTLAVLTLSDSFAAQWPLLAAEGGFELLLLAEPASAARLTDAVALVAAGGEEDALPPTLAELAGNGLAVAAVGADPAHHVATAAVRAGADEYFVLPADYAILGSWLRERAERLRALRDRSSFVAAERQKYRFDEILGESEALQQALERVARVIPHPGVTVLITGETGTGKELVARAIHYNGPRRDAPFVDVNCAAIPDLLLESELFGHEKGAFTSATATKPGLFELANGGTIFLDEIGHLPLTLQGKLLRALEERTVRRVGGTRSIAVDVRVVAATHVNLAASVRRGEFREDLYYRLEVMSIELPPLRARRGDILPLARHFLARFAEQYGLPNPRLSKAAEQALLERAWPGNVRELRNAVERAVLLASAEELGPEAFPLPRSPSDGENGDGRIPFPATIREIARAATVEMVKLCGGNKSDAARRLGISRARLLRTLDQKSTSADDVNSDTENFDED